jgi:hypothetical protein
LYNDNNEQLSDVNTTKELSLGRVLLLALVAASLDFEAVDVFKILEALGPCI